MLLNKRIPDILDCIANLSNDEVFTPPSVARKVLDILPLEIWSNPDLKWLDPACKTGVFLREIATRLMIGLEGTIPNESIRRNHIFQNMLYGISVTELTGMIARRSLYTSKDANSRFSVFQMPTDQGNIFYERTDHVYTERHLISDTQSSSETGVRCIYCNINKTNQLERGGELENYAYPFIHKTKILTNMQFDVIVGNPPFQLKDDGHGASAIPLYHLFVEQAKRLNPKYISFIIPSRWFAGGKGLDKFRSNMLSDTTITTLVDYPNASDIFPGVEIKGGVCYFLSDKTHDGDCLVKSMNGDEVVSEMMRPLSGHDVFIRHNQAISILEKVQKYGETTMDAKVSSQKPFGFRTNFKDFKETMFDGAVKIYARGRQGYIQKDQIAVHPEWIDKYKVFTPRAAEGDGTFPNNIIGKILIGKPKTCCTETYLVVNIFDNQTEAENLSAFLKTKFTRFLISLKKNTQDLNKDRFSFVPDLDMKIGWTDNMLYSKYKLTNEEISFIDSIVKEMK